jgi:hypothetical protein
LKNRLRRTYALSVKEVEALVAVTANPFLIQAFYEGESSDAIPIDQVVILYAIKSHATKPPYGDFALMLPAGNFRLRAIDESGKVLGEIKVAVK